MTVRPIRTHMIQSYLGQLRDAFGNTRQPVAKDQLRTLYAAQDYTGMVRIVRDSMRLDLRIRVGLVNEGGPSGAPAWVSRPKPMPRYGSTEFTQTLVTVFLRKSFLQGRNFEQVVMAIAHELSHIVLDGIGHALRECEEAVDLTAMLLGYRDVYVDGSEYLEIRSSSEKRTFQSLGYLTPEEVRYAAVILGKPLEDFQAGRETVTERALSGAVKLTLAAAAVVGLIWISTASPTTKTAAPTRQAASPSRTATPTNSEFVEELPPIGTSIELSRSQIRYCLSEEIRIDGARSVLAQYRSYDVSRFNLSINDYNRRCGSSHYSSGSLESVRSEVEANRYRLWTEGAARF